MACSASPTWRLRRVRPCSTATPAGCRGSAARASATNARRERHCPSMSLPVRYHLALVLVGLNVVGASVVAAFAYRTSRQSLEDQARLAVGSVAQARQQAVVRLLERRQERLNAFLGSLESLCGD